MIKTLSLPSSKSLILRHMILGACSITPTILHGVTLCDDIESMIECLRLLGSHIVYMRHELSVSPLYDSSCQTIINF